MVLAVPRPCPAGGYPRLSGALPAVEQRVADALRRAGLGGRVLRVAVDSNGFLTVGALVLTYPTAAPQARAGLESFVGFALRAVFEAVPSLDELDVTVLRSGPRAAGRAGREPVFTAAVSRREYISVSSALPGEWVRLLPRVWAADPASHSTRYPAPPVETPESDSSPPPLLALAERARELPERVRGFVIGGVVGGVLYRGSPRRRAVALTFDDGPEPLYTPLLLDTLGRLGVRATFFLVGRRADQYPYLARAVASAGHEVGNHGYWHTSLPGLSDSGVREELQRAQGAIEHSTGQRPAYLRPPGGRYDRRVVRAASQLGLVTVLWTDDPGDYTGLDPQHLKVRLLSRVYAGGILLLHQGTPNTLKVLPEVVAVLRRLGYEVTTVSGLLGR